MPPRSLKTKFIAVIVLVYLVVGLATLLAFYLGTRHIVDGMALAFAKKEALLEKNKIIPIIDREVVLAQKMADDSSLRKWARSEERPPVRREALQELESYRRLFSDKSFFIALAASRHYYVYDKKKGASRVEMVTLAPSRPHDQWFFDGLRGLDGCALNLDYNPTLGVTKVWFNAVMRGDDREKVGICGGGIDITDFLKEIVYSKEEGVSTMLIDGAGVIEAHPDRAIVEHNAAVREPSQKKTIFQLMDDPLEREKLRGSIASLAAAGTEVVAFPASFGGRNYLAAVSRLGGVGWFNVVLVDVSRVESMKAFSPIIAIIFASLLLVIVTLALLMNRMVLTPLLRLTAASREVAGGRYHVSLPVSGDDELGELNRSFNAMTATILDHTSNLESKVRERTEELSASNRELAEAQQRMTESIKYARIIQNSILPDRELRDRCLGEHFALYRPKELVGGDFYYLREFPGHFLLAAIDCTGHGVPGAFVTMTVNSVLNHVVDVLCNDDPARILSGLNRELRKTLKLQEADAGLDIALCLVDREGGRLTFAGAGLSLYLLVSGGIREIRGDLQRVGYKGSRLNFSYQNHELELAEVEACYLTTDGLLDDPCGAKGYGMGSQRFKTLLLQNARLDMQGQLALLEKQLLSQRGPYPQRDDITVLGFKPGKPGTPVSTVNA